MTMIQAPSTCPSCGSTLEWSNHLLYCRSNTCGSQATKKVEHFAKTLKIKGLGPAAISKLNLFSLSDLYDLSESTISTKLSSEKLASKLFAEIENSRKAPMNLLLPAFSIPLIGKSATEKLSTVCETIYDITKENCELAGLGPKAIENLCTWLESNLEEITELPFDFRFVGKTTPKEVKGIVCISGRLKSFKTKADAQVALEESGYSVKSSITKEVTILVNESGVESAKTKKARESGVIIVDNLQTFLTEK